MGDTGASTDGVILGMDWGKFNKSLEKGREFEDYVSERLWGLGLAVMTYGSMRYQRKGESLNGIEIKYEGKFRETKRLYIECRQEKKDWEVSGIFKRDNTWLRVMGDYKGFAYGRNHNVFCIHTYFTMDRPMQYSTMEFPIKYKGIPYLKQWKTLFKIMAFPI